MLDNIYHLFPTFKKFNGFFVVMSLRSDGNMKIYSDYTYKLDKRSVVYQNEKINKKAQSNRNQFLSKLGLKQENVVSVKSVHGNNVELVKSSDGGKFIENTDGLISINSANSVELFLSITVADCIPVVIFEPNSKMMCLLHFGWKGLVSGIINKAMVKIKNILKSQDDYIKDCDYACDYVEDYIFKSIYAGIGPGIGVCHFEVKEDILPFFTDYPEAIFKSSLEKRYFVDLKLIAKKQLQQCKINPANIEINTDCTYCKSDLFFSFRKDKIKPVKAMMVIAGFLKEKQRT